MEVEKSTSEKIERPGKEDINVKYADNTGKKPETAKAPRRRVRRFRNSLGKRNYINRRSGPPSRRRGTFSTDDRRQRGLRTRRRGIKILVRNLTRNATNSDIKHLFETIGPLKRCGINWNNLGDSKGTAEVEYLYRKDAFKACRKLDYKSIRGVPIRLEIREGQRRILLNRREGRNRTNSSGGRRFRSRSRNYDRNDRNDRNKSDSGRRRFGRRNSNRRGSSRRRDSRSERRYRKY